MKPRSLRAAAVALFALSTGAAAAPPAPSPRPALWKIADADTTIYLLGTIHALPAGYQWQDERLRETISRSDRLVIEALLDPDPAANAALLLQLGTSPGLPPLAQRVKPSQRATLAKRIAEAKLPPAMLDRLETWAAALILSASSIAKLGVSQSDGVEEKLKATFAAARKPIEGLETAELQLAIFDTLPEREQRVFLKSVLDEPRDSQAEFARMLAAWARGDEKAIARTFDKEMKGAPELSAALLTRRNTLWTSSVVARLASPGTVLVAVGAGHLAGRDSVRAMLARRGYRVERVP